MKHKKEKWFCFVFKYKRHKGKLSQFNCIWKKSYLASDKIFTILACFDFFILFLTAAPGSDRFQNIRKPTDILSVCKAAWLLGSSHSSPASENCFHHLSWELGACSVQETAPVFGKWSCLSSKGISYSAQARLLTLCPRTELESRDGDSCELCPRGQVVLPARAQLSQSHRSGVVLGMGCQLLHSLWDSLFKPLRSC